MNKILFLIFFLAFILRFWQLGSNPPSLDWDEASLGYNAYSLLKTGRDEYGTKWPISIRSFGDYKPPLYTYLTIISIFLFGLNEFSVRFISSLIGFMTIVVAYFLVKELFPKEKSIYYFLFIFYFSLSPWHLQFSRIAFEANLSLFFIVCGIWLFLKSFKNGWFFILSFISFSLSVYSYHSPRLIVPLLIITLSVVYFNNLKRSIYKYFIGLLVFILFIIPIIKEISSSTGARFSSVSVINPDERLGSSIKAIEQDEKKGDFFGKLMHNRRIVFAREILGGYLDHFNFDFLFLTGDPPGRHHAVGMGMLYFCDFPFVFLGIFFAIKQFDKNKLFLFIWFLIAPIASSLTTGTPHAVRALFYLPIYQLFIAFGVLDVIRRLMRSCGKKILLFFTFLFFILNLFYYLHMYYVHSPIEYARWWQYGYKEAVETVRYLENSKKKIIVTYYYDQPYIYFLFYNQIDPFWYQQNWGGGEVKRAQRIFGRYEFRNLDWEKDKQLQNVIFIGAPHEIPEDILGKIKDIYFPDGSVAFRIVSR